MDSQIEQLHALADSLAAELEHGGETNHIDEAIEHDRDALELCPPPHPMRSVSLSRLAIHLGKRYDRLGAMTDLEEAICLDREALDLLPQANPDRSTTLYNLAVRLHARYNQLGARQDLDEAIVLGREALSLRPQGHPDRSVTLSNLAVDLSVRYKTHGEIKDIDEAIVFNREALELRPAGHPYRVLSLNNLANDFFARYERLLMIQDLDEGISLGRERLGLHPQGHTDRSRSLNSLAIDLSTRYKRLGEMRDLDEAIILSREALHLSFPGDPGWWLALYDLAIDLSARYKRLEDLQDVDEIIVLGREAVQFHTQGHPERPTSLRNLANSLSTRYKRLGEIQDLDEAIALGRAALDIYPPEDPDRPTSLNSLAIDLHTRYKQLGKVQDLDQAILLGREALCLRPREHPDRSIFLNNLAIDLFTRYKGLGVMEDLDEAIVLNRENLGLFQPGDPDWATSLTNLTTRLSSRYEQLGEMKDLDEAIVLDRETLVYCPQGHPDRPMCLINIAAHLCLRYKQLETMEDLNDTITFVREAVSICPQQHPLRPKALHNLAIAVCSRYNEFGVMEDLDEAIVLIREAFQLLLHGHPNRSQALIELVTYLRGRFTRLKRLEDREEWFGLYAQLADIPHIVSSVDLSAAGAWCREAEDFQHHTLLLAYETNLRFIVQHLATHPLSPRDLVALKNPTSSLTVDAFSACLRQRSITTAVELLEQGQDICWSQLARLRSPLDDVVAHGPEGEKLADEFAQLVSSVRNALDSCDTGQHERVHGLHSDIQRVITNIRELPDLSRFLLPPLYSDLRYAACGGPVIIINASQHSYDALIIFFDHDPVYVPLQVIRENVRSLSRELRALTVRTPSADVTRDLTSVLRKLWYHIVWPICGILQATLPPQSRIWWCPTGEFSLLPLHAAGPYREGEQNLADLYIPSYTPTLTALIRARRGNSSNSPTTQKCVIGIGQGEDQPVSVRAELDGVGQCLKDVAMFTRIEGEECSTSRVVEELGKNEWVHLSCHSLTNRTRPFESAFYLHDGSLSIEQIIECALKCPGFAYLSMSRATVGDVDENEESLNEKMCLASAMLFAGFRSIIGPMWDTVDADSKEIASTFYKHMVNDSGLLDYTRAALALNETMKSVNIPLEQRIAYAHVGV